jgi:hypothetical protein
MYMSDYFISTTESRIQLWLPRRLPLQPTGTQLEARKKLSDAIKDLRALNNFILSACYSSLDSSICDVENVLLYNVGTGAFSRATPFGIKIRRSRFVPAECPNGETFPHYHEYTFIQAPQRPQDTNSSTFQFSTASFSSSTKPHDVWWWATAAESTPHQPILGRFSLHVELGISTPIKNVAAVLKPILDGIVAAMHKDSNPHATAVERLAKRTGWQVEEIFSRLQTPPNPFLGRRTVLRPYQDFVKWDPADHLCEDCTVLVTKADSSTCSVTVIPLE